MWSQYWVVAYDGLHTGVDRNFVHVTTIIFDKTELLHDVCEVFCAMYQMENYQLT